MDLIQAIEDAHLEGYDIRLLPAPDVYPDKIILGISLGKAHSRTIISPETLGIDDLLCTLIKEGKELALECYNENKVEV
jgi:hypothetical protein|tara:strand:+ start:1701 stop:1937 length:237 start_codon:yes stop_codon:yes gene_type:complete